MLVRSSRRASLRARSAVLAILAVSGSISTRAQAANDDKNDKKACATAAEDAQRARNESKLISAKDYLEICTRPVCPAPIRKDCEGWSAEIEKAMPTIVISAKDDGGGDILDVKVSVDGNVIANKLDGSAVPVDPGAHLFRFEKQNGDAEPVEQKVVIKESEKDRKIEVHMHVAAAKPAPAPAVQPAIEPEPKSSPPIAGYISSAVAVASLGVGVFFYVSAKHDIDDLKGQCAPFCNSSQVDPIQTKIIVSDVALGVGVVAAAAAVYFFVSHGHSSASAKVGSAPTLAFTF